MFEPSPSREPKSEPKKQNPIKPTQTPKAAADVPPPPGQNGSGFFSGAMKALGSPGSLLKTFGHFAEKLVGGAGAALKAQAEGKPLSEQLSHVQGSVKMNAAQVVQVNRELAGEKQGFGKANASGGTQADKKSEGTGFYGGFASVALTGITNDQHEATKMDQDVTGDQTPEGYAAYGNNPTDYRQNGASQLPDRRNPEGPFAGLAGWLGQAGQSINNGLDKAGDKAASWLGHIPIVGNWLGNKANQGLDAIGNAIGNKAGQASEAVAAKNEGVADKLDIVNDVAAVTQYAAAADKAVSVVKGPDGKPKVDIDWKALEKTEVTADLGAMGGKFQYDNPKELADNGCAAILKDMADKGLKPEDKSQFVSITGHSGGGQSSFYTALKMADMGYKNISLVGVDMAMTPHQREILETMGVQVTNITSHNKESNGTNQESVVGQAVQFGMGGGQNYYDINVQRQLQTDPQGRHSLNNDPAVLTMVRYTQYLDSIGKHGQYNDPGNYNAFMKATGGQGDAATLPDQNGKDREYRGSGPGQTVPTFIDQRGLPGPAANSTDPNQATNPVERIGNTLPILGQLVNGKIDGVGQGIGNAFDKAGDKASSWVSGLINKLGGAVGGAANNVIDGIGHGLYNDIDKTGDVAQALLGGIPLIGGCLGPMANQGIDALGEKIDHKIDQVGDRVEDRIGQAAAKAGNAAGGWVNTKIDQAGQGISNRFDKAGDWAGEKTHGLVGKLAGLAQGIGIDLSHIKSMEGLVTPVPETEAKETGKKDSQDIKGAGEKAGRAGGEKDGDKKAGGAKDGKKTEFSSGLGKDVDELSKKSPTLERKLTKLQDDGWTIRYGTAGKGTFADRGKKEIVIDANSKGKPLSIVQSLAHESGHADYTTDPYVAPSGKSKDQYVAANVNRNLKGEGEATITNLEIRAELMQAKAGDIGIAGAQSKKYEELFKKYPDAKDRDKLREEIGKVFAKGEVPSVNKPDGTPYANYEEYYGQAYRDFWDANVTPGKDGVAPMPAKPAKPAEAAEPVNAAEEEETEIRQEH